MVQSFLSWQMPRSNALRLFIYMFILTVCAKHYVTLFVVSPQTLFDLLNALPIITFLDVISCSEWRHGNNAGVGAEKERHPNFIELHFVI